MEEKRLLSSAGGRDGEMKRKNRTRKFSSYAGSDRNIFLILNSHL